MEEEDDNDSNQIQVDFKDVIALKVCCQPKFKFVVYTKDIKSIDDLRNKLITTDFPGLTTT